jgi:WD40-like Beta Propeller Repeat
MTPPFRRTCLAFVLVTALIGSFAAASAVAQSVTLDGVIHPDSDDTLAFTPDGNTVFFDRSEGPHKTIMVSSRIHGKWTAPRVAGFSGRWFDQDPVVAPDGSYLLFNSDRPVAPGGKPLVQNYFNGGPAPGSNIWRVAFKGAGWSAPVRLSPVINSDVFIDFASIAADGTLYFMRWNNQAKAMHIWRSALRDGTYLTPEFVVLGDPATSTHDPAIAPDQSFMVFDYGKVVGGLGRLSIAFRNGGGWTQPIDLGEAVNADKPWGAHIARDGRAAYVTGDSGIRRIPLDSWLDHRER